MSYPDHMLGAIDGEGAFTVGGDWGQNHTEASVRALWKVPAPTPGNALAVLRQSLLKLPLEALRGFEGLLDIGAGAWGTVTGAVDAIMGALRDVPVFLQMDKWDEWLGDAWNTLSRMVNQMVDIFTGMVITPINSAIQNIKDWWNGLWGFRVKTEDTQVNLQNFQIAALTANTRNPAHTCRYPIGDVTYPEFINVALPLFGDTGAASAGTAHGHDLGDGDGHAEPGVWSILAGQAMGGYLTTTVTTIYDTLGVVIRKSSGTVNNVYLEVFRERTDGSTYLISSHEVSSRITNSTLYLEVSVSGIIANAGERYLVRVRNSSTVANTLWVSGLDQNTSAFDYSWWASGSDALKTEYSSAENVIGRATGDILPWVVLAAKNLPSASQSHSDDFNRPALGPLWYLRSNIAGLAGITGNKFSFKGTNDGAQYGIYTRPTSSDAMRIDFDIHGVSASIAGAQSCAILSCNREMTQMVALAVNHVGSKIYTGSFGSAWEERASDGTTGDGRWTFYYDEELNKYLTFKDGIFTELEWEDTDNFVQHSEDFRYGGLRVGRSLFHNSALVDDFVLQDWVPEPIEVPVP